MGLILGGKDKGEMGKIIGNQELGIRGGRVFQL